jgi:hypothetical protein
MGDGWRNVSNRLWLLLAIESVGCVTIIVGVGAIIIGLGGILPTAIIATGSLLIAIGSGWYSKVYNGEPLMNQFGAEDEEQAS